MGKRRLTERQIARTRHIQAERIKRVQATTPSDTINESSSAEQPGLLIAHYGTTVFVENQAEQLFRCDIRQNLGTLATGDDVIWQQFDDTTGVVTACLPRQSVLVRATRNGPKPLVANLSQVCVVIAPEPKPQKTTIDRYLVLANNAGIDVFIVLNKIDLLEAHPNDHLLSLLEHYREIGYPCVLLSSKTHQGLDEFEKALQGERTILVGQSGVGKSSLLKALIPTAEARIQALSHLQRTGKHTTTTSRLFHLPKGGDLVDTPGANQLLIYHLSESEIAQGFKEFVPYLGQCKFRDCKHQHESGCALQEAVHRGQIQKFRLQNFFKLLNERTLRLSRNGKS